MKTLIKLLGVCLVLFIFIFSFTLAADNKNKPSNCLPSCKDADCDKTQTCERWKKGSETCYYCAVKELPPSSASY
jgi:hypothetical protein